MRFAPHAAVVTAALAVMTPSARAERVVAVSIETAAQNVVVFDKASPGTLITGPVSVSGLAADERIVGIDYRPATLGLYAVARDTVTGAGRLYTLNPTTGVATRAVDASFGPLSGTSFGMDFNPTVDRVRLVSDADQNLRVNPNDGALFIDSALVFNGADPNNGENPAVTAVAYTNFDLDPLTATTLFDIETLNDVLTIQNPPNTGTLNTVGSLSVGNADPPAAFDISERGTAGYISTGSAYPNSSFYGEVNLTTGAANTSFSGLIGNPTRYSSMSMAPRARFGVVDTTVPEGAGSVTVTVQRLVAVGTDSIDYATADGSAVAGEDYTTTSGTLTFAPGETVKTVSVPLVGDATDEPDADESFRLVLSVPTSSESVVADLDGGLIQIVDDDSPAPADDLPPTVALTAPATGASLSVLAPVTLAATASDDRGVARVAFYRGARLIGEDATAPYEVTYLPPAADVGGGTFVATAIDTAGQTTTTLRDVKVARIKPKVVASTKPKRDAADPRVFTTAGRLTLPAGVDKATACAGAKVNVRFRAGKNTISSRTVKVTKACTFRSRVRFDLPRRFFSKRSLEVLTASSGTPVLAAAKSRRSVRVR